MISITLNGSFEEIRDDIVRLAGHLTVDLEKVATMEVAQEAQLAACLHGQQEALAEEPKSLLGDPAPAEPEEPEKKPKKAPAKKRTRKPTKKEMVELPAQALIDDLNTKLNASDQLEMEGFNPPPVPDEIEIEDGEVYGISSIENPTIADCRVLIDKLCDMGNFDLCDQLMAEFGVVSISDLAKEKYSEFCLKACQILSNARKG